MNKLHPDPAVRAAQLRARELAGIKALTNPDDGKPKPAPINYMTMPLDDLKALEARVSNWLKLNKKHDNYESSQIRYKKITRFLAIRTNI